MTEAPQFVELRRLLSIARYVDPLTPTERRTFTYIAAHPGTPASNIAEAENLSPDAASRVFKRLTALELIRSERDSNDRRVTRYGMTRRGYEEMLEWASRSLGEEVKEITEVTVWEPGHS
ncbi:MarR family transcriptional regulator [Microvirga sp. VF16]|uniref:MarR family transcriptional regulator n=1 Tax=Microvirga sp. VF16 TaxID=2807101 RepID=UPI00193E8B12|nr:MarR family transcriptional regulator [Microvirga sp. VF16]QRM27902.1 MarR family transcriptional regulator [Microvirga sp. VF16]